MAKENNELNLTELEKDEIRYLAKHYLTGFTNMPIEIDISLWDEIILVIKVKPFAGTIYICALDDLLHETPIKKWTFSADCDLTPCSGGPKLGTSSAYSILDTAEKAFVELGFGIADALEDLPDETFWIEENKQ